MPVELVKLHAKFPGPPPLSEVADQVVVGEAERDRQAHCEAQRARNSAKRATTCTKAHDEEAAQRRKQQSQASNVRRPAGTAIPRRPQDVIECIADEAARPRFGWPAPSVA